MTSRNDKQNSMHHAIALLARRDHSLYELQQKLLKKGHDEETVKQVIDDLQKRGYIDDARYTQMIIRHHYLRGQGPQKIRYLLSQNGVSRALISDSFSEFDEDWFVLAKEVRQKRFGFGFKSNEQHEVYKEKSKQMRFLMTRGFETDQIHYAMEQVSQVDD